MFFFKNKSEEKVGILYDVGSASVACALVEYRETSHPTVLYMSRVNAKTITTTSTQELLQTIGDAIVKSTNNVLANGMPELIRVRKNHRKSVKITRVDAVLSEPWIVSKLFDIYIKKEKPVLITPRFVKNTLNTERKKFMESLHEIDPVFESDPGKSAEDMVIEILVNGYKTSNIYGKTADALSIKMYLSFVLQSIADKITAKASQHFNVKQVDFHTFPFVFLKGINTLYSSPKQFLTVDVTGEFTNISMIYDGVVQETKTIGFGYNALVRKVAQMFQVENEIAKSYMHLMHDGRADTAIAQKLESFYENELGELGWGTLVKKEIDALAQEFGMPKYAYMISMSYVGDIYNRAYKKMFAGLEKGGYPTMLIVNEDTVSTQCEFTYDSSADSFIGISALSFNRGSLPKES